MRKIQILGAFVAVLAFSALVVSSTSATLWLVGGESLTKAASKPSHGIIIFVHQGGSLGTAKIRCTVLLVGTVGPGAEDKITLVESLTGEKDLLGNCTTLSGFCLGAVIHPVGLPWKTRLELVGTQTWDVTFAAGFNVLCSFGVQVECKGNVESLFEGNGTNGAKFSFKGPEGFEQLCSDGGLGIIESEDLAPGETLGATVS
jgi:hypothetical protein